MWARLCETTSLVRYALMRMELSSTHQKLAHHILFNMLNKNVISEQLTSLESFRGCSKAVLIQGAEAVVFHALH